MESTGKSYKRVRNRFCILLAVLRRELPFRQFRAALRLTWCADRLLFRRGVWKEPPWEWVEEMEFCTQRIAERLESSRVERDQIRRLVHVFRHLFTFRATPRR